MGDTLTEKEISNIAKKIDKLTKKLKNKKSYTQSDYQKFCGERTGVLNKKVLGNLYVAKTPDHKEQNYLERAKLICEGPNGKHGLILSTNDNNMRMLQNAIKRYNLELKAIERSE